MKSDERWAQWSSGCYRDVIRTKHFRIRNYFTRAFYLTFNRRAGICISIGPVEFSALWGRINAVFWEDMQVERWCRDERK